MKIEVVRCDGNHEVLTLTEPLNIHRGEKFNVITTATGADHFFAVEDGRYDGWGMVLSADGASEEQAAALTEAIENDRDIELLGGRLPPLASTN